MDPLELADFIDVAPDEMEFDEHNTEEKYFDILNYHEDTPMAYRVHSSIPNTCVFRVPNDVVPPCVSCSVPVAIKKNLPPDYQMLDAIDLKLMVEVAPSTVEMDTLGQKAFWSTYSKDALKKEINCVVYKAGAVRRAPETAEDAPQPSISDSPAASNDTTPTAESTHTSDSDDISDTPGKRARGLSVSFSTDVDHTDGTGQLTGVPADLHQQVKTAADSTLPMTEVWPKVIHFLEGDEPLMDLLTLRNTGTAPIAYRILSSTPMRFSMDVSGGVLDPQSSCQINIELKSFPPHPSSDPAASFANFYIDFTNMSEDFSVNDIDEYFNSIGDLYIRRAVESRAVPWDDRFAAEARLKTDPVMEAPVEHDGYTMATGISGGSDCSDYSDDGGGTHSPAFLSSNNMHSGSYGVSPLIGGSQIALRLSDIPAANLLSPGGYSAPSTPRGAESTLNQSRFPRASVTPRCLFFLEGDEPLEDVITLRNTGVKAVLYRVTASTPSRFDIPQCYGELETDKEETVSIELKSFPIQLPAGDALFAVFHVDLLLRDINYTANNPEAHWSKVGTVYMRKSVSCRAISYDDREVVLGTKQSSRDKEAPTEYNGYAIAASYGLLTENTDFIEVKQAAAPMLAAILERGESSASVLSAGSSIGGRPVPLSISKSQSNFTDDGDELKFNCGDGGDSFMGSRDVSRSGSLGNVFDQVYANKDPSTEEAVVLDSLAFDRPIIEAPRRRPSTKHIAQEMTEEDAGLPVDIHTEDDTVNPEVSTTKKSKWGGLSTAITIESTAESSPKKSSTLSMGAVAFVSMAAAKARPAPMSRRHSLNVSQIPSEDMKNSALGMASVLSEFSKKSNSGELKLKRRASVSAGKLIVDEGNTEFKKEEMQSVLSEFSKKLGSGEIKLRRSSIVSQAEKKRKQREEEASGEFKGVLGELRYLFSNSTLVDEKEEDLRSYNTRGELIDDDADLDGVYTVISSDVNDMLSPSLSADIDIDLLKSVDSVDAEYATVANQSNDEAEEYFPESPFTSPLASHVKAQTVVGIEGKKALHQSGIFSPPPQSSSFEIEPLSTTTPDRFSVQQHDEMSAKKDQQLAQKDARIAEMNEQLDALIALQQSSADEIEFNKQAELSNAARQFELGEMSLRSECERKVEAVHQELELQQEQHKLAILSLTNQNNGLMKDLSREKDTQIRQLNHEIERILAQQGTSAGESLHQRQADTRKLSAQFEAEIAALRRLVEETKQERDIAIATNNEMYESKTRIGSLKQESEVFKLRQTYDVDISKLNLQLKELQRSKESELSAVNSEKERKIKSLTNQYELELKTLRAKLSEFTEMRIAADYEQQSQLLDEAQHRIAKYSSEVSQLQLKLDQVRAEKAEEVDALAQRYKEEFAELRLKNEQDFSRYCSKQEAKIGSLNKQLEQARSEWQSEVELLSSQKETDLAFIVKQHEAKLNSVVQNYELRLTALSQQQDFNKNEGLLKQQDEMIAALTASKDAEASVLVKQYEARISSLVQQHEAKVSRLTQELEKLSTEKEADLREIGLQKDAKIRTLIKQQGATVGALTQQLEELSLKSMQQESELITTASGSSASSPMVTHLQELLRQQEEKINGLLETNRGLDAKCSSAYQHRDVELRNLAKLHEGKAVALAQQLSELSHDHEIFIGSLKQQHDAELRSLGHKHDNKISTLNLHYDTRLEALKKRHEEDISDLKEAHEDNVRSMLQQKEDHSRLQLRQFESKQRALYKQIEQLTLQRENDAAAALVQSEDELNAQAGRHEAELAAKSKLFESRFASLTQKNDIKLLALKKDLEDSFMAKEAEIRSDCSSKEAKLRMVIQEHEATILRLKCEIDELKHQQSVSETSQQQQKGSEFRLLQKRHDAEKVALRQENDEAVQRLESEILSMQDTNESQVRMLHQKHEAEISKLEHTNQITVAALTDKFEDTCEEHIKLVDSLQLKSDAEVKVLTLKYESALSDMKRELDSTKNILESESVSARKLQEETLQAKDKEMQDMLHKLKLDSDELMKESRIERENLAEKYEAQIATLNKQLESLALRISRNESGTFLTQTDDRMDQGDLESRAVDHVSLSKESLSFSVGHEASEDTVVLTNNGEKRVAYRTRVSIQNMFIVSGGDGVLDRHQSCSIAIATKPSSSYVSTANIPVVKFAIELVEADERYFEQEAREYWNENGTHSIRKSLTAHCTVQPKPKTTELVQAKDMNSLLSSLKGRLENGLLNYDKPNATKIEIDKVGSALQHSSVDNGGAGRAVRADHTILSRPRGRVLDLLVLSLGNQNSLSPAEFEELKEARNSMPATRWDEWVRFAKAEKPRREFAERDKLISDLEGKKYADEKAGMVGNHSRRPSPARSYVMRNDLSSIRPATVSHLSSYDDRATRSLYDSSIEGPSNQLQWSDLQNSASPPAASTRAVATHYRSASPLAAAKALVSSITSGHSDMHEIKSKITNLESMVNGLDGRSRNVSGGLDLSRSYSHSTGSNNSEYGNLHSSVDSSRSGRPASAGESESRPGRDRPSSAGPVRRRPF